MVASGVSVQNVDNRIVTCGVVYELMVVFLGGVVSTQNASNTHGDLWCSLGGLQKENEDNQVTSVNFGVVESHVLMLGMYKRKLQREKSQNSARKKSQKRVRKNHRIA